MDAVGMWGWYVNELMAEHGLTETALSASAGVQQGTLNRWRHGKAVPDKAAHVAHFARCLDRNPLEAFVAAGMLDEDEAGSGLGESDRQFLARFRAVTPEPGEPGRQLKVRGVDAERAIRESKPVRARDQQPG